ncbi:MAG: DciA family protein [Gammaproteobacteria bacterium]
MDRKRPDPLSHMLSAKGTHLTSLAAEARKLEALRQCVLRSLDPETASHCLGADLKDGVLTLFMDSGAWTTTLRYQSQTILTAVQAAAKQPCRTLKLKVLPDPKPGVAPKPPPRDLSAETRRLLESTAGGVDDPDLAGSLRRLARSRKPQS